MVLCEGGLRCGSCLDEMEVRVVRTGMQMGKREKVRVSDMSNGIRTP